MTKPSPLRARLLATSVALSVAALSVAGAASATAVEEPPAPAANSVSVPPAADAAGNVEAQDAVERLHPVLNSPGLPGVVVSGELGTLQVEVSGSQLGAPAPTGLVGMFVNGEPLSLRELVAGKATFTFRPLANGESYNVIIGYGGDDVYDEGQLEVGTIEVAQAPSRLTLGTDYPVVGGGGWTEITATVSSTDPAVHGVPEGYIVLTRDGDEVARMDVDGSTGDRGFADPTEDLRENAGDGTATFHVRTPNIALGSPASYDYQAYFVPSNWFGEAEAESLTIDVNAVATQLKLTAPQSSTVGKSVALAANVLLTGPEAANATVPSGTVSFFANGVYLGSADVVDNARAALNWTPASAGAVTLTATFTPSTLNHQQSTATGTLNVVAAAPVATSAATAAPQASATVKPAAAQSALANTGADGTAYLLGGSAMALLLGAVALFGARRGRRTN